MDENLIAMAILNAIALLEDLARHHNKKNDFQSLRAAGLDIAMKMPFDINHPNTLEPFKSRKHTKRENALPLAAFYLDNSRVLLGMGEHLLSIESYGMAHVYIGAATHDRVSSRKNIPGGNIKNKDVKEVKATAVKHWDENKHLYLYRGVPSKNKWARETCENWRCVEAVARRWLNNR